MNNNISKNSENLKCSGCGVCAAICPTEAIQIKLNDKGFYDSKVNEEKCINCGICVKSCLFNVKHEFKKPIKAFSITKKNNSEKINSSSSGVCWELAKVALENGYSACGAKFNFDNNKVEHFLADTVKEYVPAQGSKYLQSYTVDAFKKILKSNNKDKYIIFGTPCQIASIRNYIKIKNIEEQFILIDFFCHGVPSYYLWENYLYKNKITKIEDIVFRDNSKEQWNDFCISIKTKDKILNSSSKENDLFYRFFILDFCLSQVCSESCMFFSTNSCADMRFGDVWNRKIHNIKNPMSLGLIYNEKFEWILKKVEKTQEFKEEDLNEIIKGQPMNFRKHYKLTNQIIDLLKRKFSLKILLYVLIYPKLIIGKFKKIKKR